jgi:hypothetical protein
MLFALPSSTALTFSLLKSVFLFALFPHSLLKKSKAKQEEVKKFVIIIFLCYNNTKGGEDRGIDCVGCVAVSYLNSSI